MFKTTWGWVSLGVLLMSLAACGGRPVLGEDDAAVPDLPAPPDVGPDLPPTPLATCTPQPLQEEPIALNVHGPFAFAQADGCRLNQFDALGELQQPPDGAWSGSWHNAFFASANGEIVRTSYHTSGAVARRETFNADLKLIASESFREDGVMSSQVSQVFDAQGHMLSVEHTALLNGSRRTTQVWNGDQLIERTMEENGTPVLRYSWSYNQSGLLATSQVDFLDSDFAGEIQQQRATWSYDAEGRPTEVARFIDGTLVYRQTWTWSAEGLKERQVSLWSLAPWSFYPRETDSFYDRRQGYRVGLGQAEGCAGLPIELTYGYPEAEYEPTGAWHHADQFKQNIDCTNQAFCKVGPSLARLTHFGVRALGNFENVPKLFNGKFQRAEIRTTYDDVGRMLSERLEIAPDDPSKRMLLDRSRSLNAIGNVVTDVLQITPAGAASQARTITLSYDAEARVSERRLHRGEQDLLHETLTYAPGATIFTTGVRHGNGADLSEINPTLHEWKERSRVTRTFDGAGRIAHETLRTDIQQSERTFAFDDQGRLISIEAIPALDRLNRYVATFDANGQPTFVGYHFETFNQPFELEWHDLQRIERDSAGRPIQYETEQHPPITFVGTRTTFQATYICP